MPRTRAKTIKIPLGDQDNGNLAELFNQMLGTESCNINIAHARWLRIRGLCDQLLRLFEMLIKSPVMRDMPEFKQSRAEIAWFIVESRTAFTPRIDLNEYEWNLSLVPPDLKEKFIAEYTRLKTDAHLRAFVIMCDNLIVYKKYLALDKLNHKFITNMPGCEWRPLPFTELDIKYAVSMDSGENMTRFFMTVLSKALEFSHKLYQEISSPDIDIDQFSDIIMSNIDRLQRLPELSRCRKAFQKIRNSVDMLKGNFGEYYRDFVETKDSTIIVQHFIIDVSKNTDADPQVLSEFRRIIMYYRKVAGDQITNPKIQKLFDTISEGLKEAEKGTRNLVNIKSPLPDDDDDDTPAPVPSVGITKDELGG